MAEAPSPRRTEPDPPSADGAAALLNTAWADPERGLLLWLTMITGSRRGETSALRWRATSTSTGAPGHERELPLADSHCARASQCRWLLPL